MHYWHNPEIGRKSGPLNQSSSGFRSGPGGRQVLTNGEVIEDEICAPESLAQELGVEGSLRISALA